MRTQTRRHSHLVSLLGIRHVVLAVNKLDLVGYDRAVFTAIERDHRAFAAGIGLTDITCVPISAMRSDNMTGADDHALAATPAGRAGPSCWRSATRAAPKATASPTSPS